MDEKSSQDIRLARLLDANFNRAREAARVLEDAARFLLDDAALTETAKDLRHRLSAAALRLPAASRFSQSRDTPGDVGTEITAATELSRPAVLDVIHAAFGRLSEALRTLEEYSKVLHQKTDPAAPAVDGPFKQLRYETYILHARLVRRLQPKASLSRLRLCVLLTEDPCRPDWRGAAAAALDAGADCLHLRGKGLNDAEMFRRAKALADLCHRHDALLIMQDRPDIAVLAGADGVHGAPDGLPVDAVRRIAGPDVILGRDAFTLGQALAAVDEGADYVAIGPVFGSAEEPPDRLVGLEDLRRIAAQLKVPLMAAGGITAQNVEQVVAAGARAVAIEWHTTPEADAKAAAEVLRGCASR